MRVLVDLRSHVGGVPQITQVEQVPADGTLVSINGKYVLPIVPGAEFPVDGTSYVLDGGGDVDGGDVSSISFAHLLAMYPQFGHVYFNPLLTAANVAELDLTFAFSDPLTPGRTMYPRLQTGRVPGPVSGQMPTHTALLGINSAAIPPRPGLMVSDEIDISALTAGVGADEFMVYWKILGFQTGTDVRSEYGATAGINSPALRSVIEVDQEPSGFSAYISPDNGDHWCEVGLLEPVAFCEKTTKFRVAFRNSDPNRVYMAHFAVLF